MIKNQGDTKYDKNYVDICRSMQIYVDVCLCIILFDYVKFYIIFIAMLLLENREIDLGKD